jgi:membrane protein
MRPKVVLDVTKETFKEWSSDQASRLAAALSYYAIFSMAPLLLVLISVAGLVLGQAAAQGEIVGQIQQAVGPSAAQAIQSILAHTRSHTSGIIGTVVGTVTLLLGAAGLFGQLQGGLNTVWGVRPKPGGGILRMLKNRALGFAMVLLAGIVLLLSLVLSAGLSALGGLSSGVLPGSNVLWQVLSFVVAFAVITLMVALIFKYLPHVQVAWRDIWIGAAVTGFLFSIGKYLLGLYLGRSSASSTYGAAGSLVVLLLWVYYSAQIFYLGAEFTQVYARRFGSDILPNKNAFRVTQTMQTAEEVGKESKPPGE